MPCESNGFVGRLPLDMATKRAQSRFGFPRFFSLRGSFLSCLFAGTFGTQGHHSPVIAFFCLRGPVGGKENDNEQTGPIFVERTPGQGAESAQAHSRCGGHGAWSGSVASKVGLRS